MSAVPLCFPQHRLYRDNSVRDNFSDLFASIRFADFSAAESFFLFYELEGYFRRAWVRAGDFTIKISSPVINAARAAMTAI